jgi:hypothetical protein
LVTSLTVGALENVAIARYCPVSPMEPNTIPLGIIVSERMFAPLLPVPPVPLPLPLTPPLEPGTVRRALELIGPLNAVALAVIVVVPALTAVATPEALTVATEGRLELQVTALVMFCVDGWFALPNVPVAVN